MSLLNQTREFLENVRKTRKGGLLTQDPEEQVNHWATVIQWDQYIISLSGPEVPATFKGKIPTIIFHSSLTGKLVKGDQDQQTHISGFFSFSTNY